ncbi:MAG: C45 family autoproteolytic acyltransferase/hydrolase, partial [candidate division KSB1 bacterium]|nr:C45 family autoproteolytic acyltransferase/hydrolase [candidate division KSB1 bacterium]
EKVDDITDYIPEETITWFDKGFRYNDRGWIFVHIEGEPYQRGYQYGYLIAEEMVEYVNKLAIEGNEGNPENGWRDMRFVADAFMLRKYEKEYLLEMRGIADGANNAGMKLFDRELDLIDVVTMNSAIDIEWARYAMPTTPNPLSGETFFKTEDELDIPEHLHKCSAFLANRSSTRDGRIVFGQIFMWGGYTGPHWNVICDIVPSEGHRLVYETFPGGIHSGADFYINASGIMIGETTVSQTPFNPDGSPQSNRIRKAAQYASSIDDVVDILVENNNGMYANDWLIGDTKTDEIAVLLLGTNKHKLWRSSKEEFYGNTVDFYWCNNNNKDAEVRKEYVPNKDNAPHDLIFRPWNRDIAFNEFYQEQKGKMDAIAGVNAWATSPINRPHACDGKVTTSEMAEKLVFLAHSGKVTLRSKFVGENKRIPDLPGATPRLSLGYSVISPVFITDKIKELRAQSDVTKSDSIRDNNFSDVIDAYSFNERDLWFNTVYPASDAENWFISGTAAYWRILKNMPEDDEEILSHFSDEFAALNCRYLYTTNREGTLTPVNARRMYDRYNHYQVPRIKGTYLLHQLRLLLGNDTFSGVMNEVHDKYREKEMRTSDFMKIVERISGEDRRDFISQWLKREDVPGLQFDAERTKINDKWQISLRISQPENSYHFFSTVKIETGKEIVYKMIEVSDKTYQSQFEFEDEPLKLTFNALHDVPLNFDNYFTWSNFYDDFDNIIIVYGTKRQIDANHTLASRFSTMLADRYTETLLPIRKESEITEDELKNNDLIVIGNSEDNSLMQDVISKLNIQISKNMFTWNGQEYAGSDEGLYACFPNPYNPAKAVHLFSSNSALQLYRMTKDRYRMPSWAIFKGDVIVEKGYHVPDEFVIDF